DQLLAVDAQLAFGFALELLELRVHPILSGLQLLELFFGGLLTEFVLFLIVQPAERVAQRRQFVVERAQTLLDKAVHLDIAAEAFGEYVQVDHADASNCCRRLRGGLPLELRVATGATDQKTAQKRGRNSRQHSRIPPDQICKPPWT